MDEDYNMVCGIDKLAELLIERGIEFCVNDEVSLAFKDDVGNQHECWMAGADENRVNALIVVTPEQLLSVPDLNGIIAENAKLRKAAGDAWSLFVGFGAVHPYNLPEVDRVRESLQELGIEVDGR